MLNGAHYVAFMISYILQKQACISCLHKYQTMDQNGNGIKLMSKKSENYSILDLILFYFSFTSRSFLFSFWDSFLDLTSTKQLGCI